VASRADGATSHGSREGRVVRFAKAHADENDFVLVSEEEAATQDLSALARALCHRHRGPGGDGLIVYGRTPQGARMRLFNADGTHAEISGNGLRCLAAYLAWCQGSAGERVIHTDAGAKRVVLLHHEGRRFAFRAEMGPPEEVRPLTLEIDGTPVPIVTMRVGNPQCVVLDEPVDEAHLHRLGPRLSRHPAFPGGTNVELLEVESAERLRILIWERGVGPTRASGTGACAAAVAAAVTGRAAREVEVVAPGGAQRVEWRDEGLYLTGWAEVILEGRWFP
jgi:diaminopimelate epimerase